VTLIEIGRMLAAGAAEASGTGGIFLHQWIVYQIKNREHNTNSQFQMHSSGYIFYVKNDMFRLFQSSSGFFTLTLNAYKITNANNKKTHMQTKFEGQTQRP
jgi:hypothetical protein